ncbi:hypothetical protein C2G38_2092182, partial [Gigaspora rosea]
MVTVAVIQFCSNRFFFCCYKKIMMRITCASGIAKLIFKYYCSTNVQYFFFI